MDNVSIILKISGVEIPSHPVFGDDVKLKIAQEENQVFLRSKIDGKIKFVGSDFDFIASCSHDTEFTLEVKRGSSSFGSGTFLKSDCDLNYDDKTCDVKMTITDRYEKFLANYDNKYNLVKLAPATQELVMTKRSVLQIYMFGDTKITNYVGNMSFESDATNNAQAMSEAAILTKAFTKVRQYVVFKIEMTNSAYSYLDGTYYGDITGNSSERIWRSDQQYYISYYGGGVYSRTFFTANGTRVHHGTDDMIGIQFEAGYAHSMGNIMVLDIGGDTQIGWAYYDFRNIFARLLTDKSSISGWSDTPVAISSIQDDIGANNTSNFQYAVGATSLNLYNNIIISLATQSDPTEWGEDGNGKYFVQPSPSSVDNVVFAIGWNMWIPMSFWLEGTSTLYSTIGSKLDTTYTLPDAYPLHEAISKLLKEVDSSVTFTNSALHSNFLYQPNGFGQAFLPTPILWDDRYLFVTPITNVKKTRYEQAAQRGDMTLKQLLDMLRNVYQCYWYIDDYNRLVIEHISFFKHGRNYILGASDIDVDLTTMKDMPNGLPWAFGTNGLSHKRNLCPRRYEFAWGGECTPQFNGEAIDIEDAYVSTDKKEKVQVNNFTADIDYTVINPSGVDDDIYALIEAEKHTSGGITKYTVQIPSVRLTSQTPKYAMQNGYCSFLYAEANYWNYDLGGWRAKAGGVYLPVMDVKRFVEQSVGIPLKGQAISQANILTVKTGLGLGGVTEMEVNADTMYAKTKLLLDSTYDYTIGLSMERVPVSHSAAAWEITNNSKFHLLIKYLEPSTGNIGTAQLAPEDYIDTGVGSSTPKTIILYAVPDPSKITPLSDFVISNDGLMTANFQEDDQAFLFQFLGNRSAGYDWGYIKMKSGDNAISIQINPSTEANYDFGYVSLVPIPRSSEVTSKALKYASGTTSQVVTIPAHTEFFLGYSKDVGSSGNNDTVTFAIL